MPGHLAPVVTLIDVKPGLVAPDHIDLVTHAIFDDLHGWGYLAPQCALARRQALPLAGCSIRPLVDRAATRGLDQRLKPRLAPELHTRREKLHHQLIAIAVHHQAGQTISLAKDQADGARTFLQS